MTFDEYINFLEQYWKIFGPPKPKKLKGPFKIALL